MPAIESQVSLGRYTVETPFLSLWPFPNPLPLLAPLNAHVLHTKLAQLAGRERRDQSHHQGIFWSRLSVCTHWIMGSPMPPSSCSVWPQPWLMFLVWPAHLIQIPRPAPDCTLLKSQGKQNKIQALQEALEILSQDGSSFLLETSPSDFRSYSCSPSSAYPTSVQL